MPEFTKYGIEVDVDVDVDIDVNEFLDECVSSEIDEVIEWLIDSDYIKSTQVVDDSNMSLGDKEYINIISKLTDPMVRFRLSEEDLYAIQQISDKL
jgi:hypothetical protein